MAFISTGAFGLKRTLSVSTSAVRPIRSAVTMSEKSASVPFLEKPAACDGTMGAADVGFDPLYLSNVFDIKWLREAELKHGRVCMLATLGFIVQEFVHLPGPMFQNKLATTAHWSVPQEGMLQIFLFCGLIEFITHKGKLTYENMHSAGEEPGNFGFDPLGLGKNPATLAKYKANEILNGRLAMIAIGGFIHQMWITKQPIVEQLQNFKPLM